MLSEHDEGSMKSGRKKQMLSNVSVCLRIQSPVTVS